MKTLGGSQFFRNVCIKRSPQTQSKISRIFYFDLFQFTPRMQIFTLCPKNAESFSLNPRLMRFLIIRPKMFWVCQLIWATIFPWIIWWLTLNMRRTFLLVFCFVCNVLLFVFIIILFNFVIDYEYFGFIEILLFVCFVLLMAWSINLNIRLIIWACFGMMREENFRFYFASQPSSQHYLLELTSWKCKRA